MECVMSKKVQKIIFFVVFLYLFIGFFIVPYVLKQKIIELVEQKTHAKLHIDRLSFNPFIFELYMKGLELTGVNHEQLFSLKSLLLNVELSSLARLAVHVSELTLEEPKVFLVYDENKTLNMLTILKPNDTPEDENTTQKNELPRVIIDTIAIKNGTLNYEDFTKKSKFDFSWNQIGFELKNIDTYDFTQSDGEIRLYLSLGDGGLIDLKSKILGFKPLVLEGSLNFESSKLYTPWKYLRDSLRLEVADGKLSFSTKYALNLDDLNATKFYNLNMSLENLRVKPTQENQDILNLDSFYLHEATIKPMTQDVYIQAIGFHGLHVKANRDASGELDWSKYTQIKTANKPKIENIPDQENLKKQQTTPPAWSVKVDALALEKIKIDFLDKGIEPRVMTKVNDFNLYVQNITLAGVEPLMYQMDMKLNKKLQCSSHGSLIHKELALDAYVKCTDFDVAHYEPYITKAAKEALEVYDLDLQTAEVDFDANVSLKDVASQIVARVNHANVSLNHFALNKNTTQERLLDFSKFDIHAITLDTKTKELTIDTVMLDDLGIKSVRYKNERLNFEDLVRFPATPQVPTAQGKSQKITTVKNTKEEKSYSVKLHHFGLNGGDIHFDDRVVTPSFTSKIDAIHLNAYGFDSEKNSWLKYDLAWRVNGKGETKSSGKIRHTPLKAEGLFELKKIALASLSPYIKEHAFVTIEDGYLSTASKFAYEQTEKNPRFSTKGSFSLENLYVSDTRDASCLMSVEDLGLNSFTFESPANKLYVHEIDLNALYVNVFIDKDKNMNLASLSNPKKETKTIQTTQVPSTPSASHAGSKKPFSLDITTLNITNSSAKFADLSLPLPFQTNIHDLNGVVYAISNVSGETSYVDIKGEVDKYGSTQLKGTINAGNPKEYMDLSFDFRNLDLSSVSGYSASFAGRKIDAGKLFLDLNYNILDSQLLSKNSIIIKKIQLGDEVKDAGKPLPLGLVIALLEDEEGVIDIDMPIEGNVDAPDFKYGALVLKTIGNLIVQAVTSPFRFLGSMMGIDAEQLDYAEFKPGLSKVISSEHEKLDNIAKMMAKRPKIALSITPVYDETVDKKGLQGEKLAAMVVQKSGVNNKETQSDAMRVELLEEIYKELIKEDALSKIKNDLKATYKDDALERAYLSTLKAKCQEAQSVSKEELELLATSRASALKSYLIDEKNIDTQRIKILKIDTLNGDNEKWVRSTLAIDVE